MKAGNFILAVSAAALSLTLSNTVFAQTAPAFTSTGAAPTPAPTATAHPRIMMLRWFVSDGARAEKFYHAVFGATTVQKMGDKVRIMVFPGGTLPGLIIIESADAATRHGSFVIQMPDLKDTLQRAQANGGQLENTHFAEPMGGMAAQSSHFIDPDGNEIEVLQMSGGATAPAKP